jgi:uncharacterized membrane protein (DUF2068 family)
MLRLVQYAITKLREAVLDVFPIILVIVFFQVFVIQKPFANPESIIMGFGLVILGLAIFVLGLETALFPVGERMANQFAQRGNALWVIAFAFSLGFATTIAEPGLTMVAAQAAKIVAAAGMIADRPDTVSRFTLGYRMAVALSVGFAIALGVLRIIKGWSLVNLLLWGYGLAIVATVFSPRPLIALAYDSGGITTSTITVPLVAALGVGLASVIRGRNPVLDGFGLIALASLTPMFFVIAFGLLFVGG